MFVLSLLAAIAFLLMTRYRVWIYAAVSGGSVAFVLWHLNHFLNGLLPLGWQSFSVFLAVLWLYACGAVVVLGYQKWQRYKHKQSAW